MMRLCININENRQLEAAQAELDEAFNWYEAQQQHLGVQFLTEFDAAIRRIFAYPALVGQVVLFSFFNTLVLLNCFSAWHYGFEEYFCIIFHIGNQIDVFINRHYEHTLVRIFFLVWVSNIIQKP